MEIKCNDICRCCLSEEGNMKNMLEANLILNNDQRKITLFHSYTACSGVDSHHLTKDETWKNICQQCETKLTASYEFRELCQESNRVLQERTELLPEVKDECLSDEEIDKRFVYAECAKREGSLHQFNQVFVKESDDGATVLEPVIKIEEDDVAAVVLEIEEKPVPVVPETLEEDDTKSNGSHRDCDDFRDDDDDEGESTEKNKNEKYDAIETMNGKFMCFQCDHVMTNIREYLAHRKDHTEYVRIDRKCFVCEEHVSKGYKRHLEQKHKDFRPFECGTCPGKYPNFYSLTVHLYTHSKRKTFQCMATNCGLKFQSPVDLRRHIIESPKHRLNAYHCQNCGMSFGKFAPLFEHYKQTHDEENSRASKVLPCFHCKKQFLQRKTLLDHNCKPIIDVIANLQKKRKGAKLSNFDMYRLGYVEVDTTPQTCRHCDKVFVNDDEFVCHQHSVCLEKPKFVCTTCGKDFVSITRLNSHKLIHENRRFICDACGICFTSKAGLAAHKRSHTDGRNFKCEACPAAFVDKNGLKSHMKCHQERKFECNLCGKLFRAYENIKLHMSIHSEGLLKFDCTICGKKFARNCDLKRHSINFHSNASLSRCGFCPRVFRDPAVLKRHNLDMHQQIYYECKHCAKHFSKAEGLKSHLFQHRGFYPYNCPVCPRKFIKKYMFSKHLMKQHSMKYDEKEHGYREQEVNMRQILAECARNPRDDAERRPPIDMEISENAVRDEEKQQQPDYGNASNFMNDAATTAPWNPAHSSSYEGYTIEKQNFQI